MRLSTGLVNERSVNAITQQQREVSKTQLQISSGKKVSSPADDPIGASRMLSLINAKKQTEQYMENINVANTHLSFEENAMHSVGQLLTSVQQKSIQALNGSLTASDRKAISAEIKNILNEMVSLANTKSGRDFIFAGFKKLTQPVVLQSNGKYTYAGDEGTSFAQIGPSSHVPIADNGKHTFFQLPVKDLNLSGYTGQHAVTTTQPGQVTAGTLSTLTTNELKINETPIAATTADGVSDTDAAGSAIAIAAAINASSATHFVQATANPTVLDLGVLTPAALNAGDLTINGQQIIDATGTESSILTAINAETATTGIVASQPGGAGTAVLLTAADGRNIHLATTAGGGAAQFTNFNMAGAGALDTVTRSTVTLTNHQSFTIGGSLPADVGLVSGTINNAGAANTGTGVMSTPIVAGVRPETATDTDVYLIRFHTPNPNPQFSIYKESDPTTPLTGFSQAPYTSGQKITFEGLEVTLTGTPNANDTFTVQVEPVGKQDIFTTLQNLLSTLENTPLSGDKNSQYAYEIGVALDNFKLAEDRILQIRAEIGARLNFVNNQKDGNDQFILFASDGISKIEDLDFTEAITRLTQNSFALEAAQSSFVRIQGLSLFNFL